MNASEKPASGLRVAVAIDSWSYPYNGGVVSTRRFASALAASGMKLTVLAVGDRTEQEESNVSVTPFPVLSVPGFNRLLAQMRVPLARSDRNRIRNALRNCDLLHVQFPFWLGFACIGEARKLGIPVICSFHVQPENILSQLKLGSGWLCTVLYRLFSRLFFNRATIVIAPTEFAADLLHRHGVRRPIVVISNGVPGAFFDIARPSSPSRGERFRLLSVGRLAAEKQHEVLFRAVARSAHRDKIDIVLAGTGPRESELKARAASLGISARIGAVSDEELLALYAGADLFVHCGTVELEGMSVLEAMASGNAVIVCDSATSAAAHIAADGAVTYRMGDERDLAGKIDGVLGDPARLAALGDANRGYARAFSHQRSVARLLDLYADVAARGENWRTRRDSNSRPPDS